MKKIISAVLASFLLTAFLSVPLCAADVSAYSAILIETSSGDVVFEKNAREKLPMASTTKIMTAVCVLENSDPDSLFTVPKEVCGIEGSSIYLIPGETLSIRQLLYAVMLESANDAAAACAYAVSGSQDAFADLMNQTALRIGLSDTHFTNPHGLDDEAHYTTASDLAKLMAYAMGIESFREIVSTAEYTISSVEGKRFLSNHNKLLKLSDDVTGGKTGFTKRSGRCLVSSAERDGVSLIAVTLNAPDDWNDHLALHELGFSSYSMVHLAEQGEFNIEIPCVSAPDGKLTLTNRDKLSVCLKNNAAVETVIESGPLLFAPVVEGDVCGKVIFTSCGKVLGTLPLYASHDIELPGEKTSLFDRIFNIIK